VLDVEWLPPWRQVGESAHRAALESQLIREVPLGHILYGQRVRLIARRVDSDHALFLLSDGRVAEVHLTWRQGCETDPSWPATATYPSLGVWTGGRMIPQHKEWNDQG
jgi:hypothetical protein